MTVRTRRSNGRVPCIRSLGENDGEALTQVPVDVTVEDPGSRIVGNEADGDIVRGRRASVDDITAWLRNRAKDQVA
jgi:hypothetical protein